MPRFKVTMVCAEWHEYTAYVDAEDVDELDTSNADWEHRRSLGDVDSISSEVSYEETQD